MKNTNFVEKTITEWLEFKVSSQGRSLSTAVKYRGYIEKLIQYLKNIDRDVFSAEREDLVDFTGLHSHKAGLAPGSRKAVVAAVRDFYKYLFRADLIKANPAVSLEYPAIGRRMPIAMQLQNAERILMQPDIGTLNGLRDATIIALLAGCGMRVSGLCKLNESAIFAFLDNKKNERYALRVTEKGGHQRALPLPHEASILLTAYLGHPDLAVIDRSLESGDKVIFVTFKNRQVPEHEYRGEARRISEKSVWRLMQKHAISAGIPKDQAHPHALRHLLGKEMAEEDATLIDMQAQLGHADPSATAIYVQIALRKRMVMIDKANPLGKIKTPVSPLVDELKRTGSL